MPEASRPVAIRLLRGVAGIQPADGNEIHASVAFWFLLPHGSMVTRSRHSESICRPEKPGRSLQPRTLHNARGLCRWCIRRSTVRGDRRSSARNRSCAESEFPAPDPPSPVAGKPAAQYEKQPGSPESQDWHNTRREIQRRPKPCSEAAPNSREPAHSIRWKKCFPTQIELQPSRRIDVACPPAA